MKLTTAIMTKTMKATAIMTRKEVVSADLAEAKAAVDAANEEISADLDTGIALVASNYSDIKAAITAKGVDMTGIMPSGYDTAIESIGGSATAADILAGKTATVDAGKITGTRAEMPVYVTGQTAVFTAGDDGTYQAGLTYPNPRFADNGDGTQTDLATGLMWRNEIQPVQTFANAIAVCESMNFAGYTDWRLPNRNEMWSILWGSVAASVRMPFAPGHFFYPAAGLIITSLDNAWTSSSSSSDNYGLYANLQYPGIISIRAKTATGVVLAVRGPIAL